MPNETLQEQTDRLFEQAYKTLGKSCFVFISPTSLEPELSVILPRFEKSFRAKYKKQSQLIGKFIETIERLKENTEPVKFPVLDLEEMTISTQAKTWLIAINTYFHTRFANALPELAEYGIEFFLPPQTEKEEAQYKLLGIEKTELEQTIAVDLPYSIVLDEGGEIDLKGTKNMEAQTYLIKSKLAGLSTLNYPTSILTEKLQDFPQRAFFVINHMKEIEQIAREIVQRVFDNMMHLAYNDLARGISPKEAKTNALAQILDMSKKKKLEELIVFRAPEDMTLELFVLGLINSLRELNEKISNEVIREFYPHVFVSLTELINQNQIIPGAFYNTNIREATEMETIEDGAEYVL
ncbi:hypothetical protein GF389_03640, partial [Candidatus Dojkabacteria bacterium]|nr:hypothetical protein [Candidatus Dojkabacteria bacterium]